MKEYLLIFSLLSCSLICNAQGEQKNDALQNLEHRLGQADFIMDSIGQHSVTAYVRYYKKTQSIYMISPNKELLCVINLGTSPVTCSECKESIKVKLCI